MHRRTRLLALAGGVAALGLIAATTAVITPDDISTGGSFTGRFDTADTRNDGSVSIVDSPTGAEPHGSGAVEMSVLDGTDKAQLITDEIAGTALADLTEISYSEYRTSGSTNPAAQHIGLNLAVNTDGAGGGFTTLVYEPVYNDASLADDTWTTRDAHDGGQGVWWSTRDLGNGVCAFSCFVTWDQIVTAIPDATLYAGGFSIGSGWNGAFVGYTDGLTFSTADAGTFYDFEVAVSTKDDCKQGGWEDFTSPEFRNQGDCVSHFASASD